MFRERVRIRFGREGTIRFVSHGDMMRLFERALRRTGMPLRMTEGFNRHPRLSFPLPLAVGWEARNEVMEFELSDWARVSDIRRMLDAQMPPGVSLGPIVLAGGSQKAQVMEAVFELTPTDTAAAERLTPDAAQGFMALGEFEVRRIRKKKYKQVDIRPFVRDVQAGDGMCSMRMAVSNAGTAKPEEVLLGMGFAAEETPTAVRVCRANVILRGDA